MMSRRFRGPEGGRPIGFSAVAARGSLAGTATTGKASTRDRLLDAAGELFYREGVCVGVEALCRTAGVSTRSMHQLFASKDEVLAASLERRLPVYEARTASAAQGAATPRERILRVFERLEQASIEPAYRGCPYLAALVELKDPDHPASVVARIETLEGLATVTVTGLSDVAGVKQGWGRGGGRRLPPPQRRRGAAAAATAPAVPVVLSSPP